MDKWHLAKPWRKLHFATGCKYSMDTNSLEEYQGIVEPCPSDPSSEVLTIASGNIDSNWEPPQHHTKHYRDSPGKTINPTSTCEPIRTCSGQDQNSNCCSFLKNSKSIWERCRMILCVHIYAVLQYNGRVACTLVVSSSTCIQQVRNKMVFKCLSLVCC